ncbi:hypothetical protein M427DRAFT_246920 [Gonapodya prolifera JEL478]|uniref:Uncharacterized protein n=1 Tax=Gonapodya prolifera (strain JEL478) TaxID=1344416 RepID=A0A139AMM8_GONPJ|nr:hypothetical protein M427DRAFT_246920 [Gonapodya prolifera JEL478]|eukprot:KXS17824.1 hypothetical protein M427DRAFT_246920 [Gonapodya prolifera JEL478]
MADKSGKKRFKWSGLFGFGGPEGPQLGSGGLESSLPTHHEVSHTRSTSGSAVGGGSGGGVAGFFGSLGSASGLSAIPGSSPAREPPSQGNANGSPRLHLNLHPTESLSLYSGAGTGPKDSSHTPPTRGHAYSLSLGAPTGDSLAMVPSSGPSYLYSQSSVPSTLPISSSSRRLSDAPDVIPPRHISARGLRQSQANPSAPPTTGSLSLSTSHSSVLPSKPPQLPNTIYSSTSLNYTPTNPYLLSRPDQPQSGSLEPEPFDRALPPIPASGPPFDADGFHRSSAQPLIYERDRDRGDRPSPRRGRNPNLPAPLFLAASPDPNAGLQPPRTRDRRVTSESEPDRTPSRNNRFSLPFLSSPTPPESPTTASASRSGSSPSPRTPQATGATSTTSPPSPKLLSANSVGALSSTSSPKSSAATLAASSPAVPPPPSSSLTVPGAKFQSPPSPTTAEAEESSKSRSRPLSWLGVSRRSTSRERSPQPSFRRSFGDLDSAISALTKPWTFGLSSKPAAADITPPDADRGRQRARTTSAKMTVISQSKPDRAVGKSKADAPLFVQQSPSTLTRQPDFASPVPPPRNRRTTAQDRSTSRNRDGRERTAEFSYLSPTSSVSPTSPISLHKALPATPIADLTFATAKPSFSGPKPAVDLHRSNTNKEVTQKPRTRTQPHEEEVTQPVWTPTVPSRKERDAPRTEEKAGLAEYEREKPAAVSQDHERKGEGRFLRSSKV